MKRIIIVILLFVFMQICKGQDTIRTGSSIRYSSAIDAFRGKMFYAKAKYAKEEIIYSASHRKIDYCYYDDTQRVCKSLDYSILADSILNINGHTWIFKKRNDRYFLKREIRGYVEEGYVKTLIPFAAIGLFTTTSKDKKDTLWFTEYASKWPEQVYSSPSFQYHRAKVKGKIYDAKKIDVVPKIFNNDSILLMDVTQDYFCFGEPYAQFSVISFVITKEGRIVNINQYKGKTSTFDDCGTRMLDIIRHLYQFPPIQPILKNGKPINVKCSIRVKCRESNH